jgi:peptidylprolyl isomerase
MKQFYLIGIGIAIVLLALLGLSKLTQQHPSTALEETTETAGEQASENDTQPIIPVTEEQTMSTTSSTSTSVAPEAPAENTVVVMKTNKGDITIELYTKDMPLTTDNFLKLVRQGFYDNVKFHRVIDGFMIQGGDPLTKDDAQAARWGTGGPGYTIPDEFGPRYSNTTGTIAMANAGPNTGGSQFFINTADNVFLDGKHPVFGKVVSGMDVVNTISKTPTGPNDVPLDPIVIESIAVQP